MKRIFRIIWLLALASISCFSLSAQNPDNKTLAYYSTHEAEILKDAQIAFFYSDYGRTIELCEWHFIIVGDTTANALKERAQQCRVLSHDMQTLSNNGDKDSLKEKAMALWGLNLYDEEATRYLGFVIIKGVSNNHAWVDLGLSVKWSVCNLGAFLPDEKGFHYRWGESVPFYGYSKGSKYRFKVGGDSYENLRFSKYNTNNSHGTIDNKTTLEFSDDAARVNWGSNWRMPTKEECEELLSNCTIEQILLNGQKGYWIVSRINKNFLFIPKADNKSDYFNYHDGAVAYYWSSSLNENDPSQAYVLKGFWISKELELDCYYRDEGLSIRPVIE